jgi:acyl-coenzyme A thioesterase PaaI-like protein
MDSKAPEEELLAAAEAAERFAERLEQGPRGRSLWGFAESATAGNTRAFLDNSPVIGLGNPVAPPLSLRAVGDHVEGTATYGRAYEGPPGHVHGGIVAAAFDEVLGMAQSLTGAPGMTGTLTVRYRRPTPLYRELTFRGQVDRVEGRKIFTSATLHVEGEFLAEAEGIFISVGVERFEALAEQREQGKQ